MVCGGRDWSANDFSRIDVLLEENWGGGCAVVENSSIATASMALCSLSS